MSIIGFWAQDFRSLADVRLGKGVDGHGTPLGEFSVFYGPNGAGKSNVLAAMATWTRLVRELLACSPGELTTLERQFAHVSLPPSDVRLGSGDAPVRIGARLAFDPPLLLPRTIAPGDASRGLGADEPTPEVVIEVVASPTWARLELIGDHVGDFRRRHDLSVLDTSFRRIRTEVERAYFLVPAVRSSMGVNGALVAPRPDVLELLAAGRVSEALGRSRLHPDPAVAGSIDRLNALLEAPPLHLQRIRPVQDPITGLYALRQQVGGGHELPLDLAGLGIVQVVTILAQILVSGARAVAIEEPEAHLHAPTMGKTLRTVLQAVVRAGHVQQLFVATHSNLFDLDPTRYFDVRLDDGQTVVTDVDDLTRIDRDHLYEPGPAKHALLKMLEYLGAGEVVAHDASGQAITAGEMLVSLQQDDDRAVAFLQDLHGAALRVVRRTAAKRVPST